MKNLYGIDSISTKGGNGFDLYPPTHQGKKATRETERGGIHKTQNREFQNKYMEISSLFRKASRLWGWFYHLIL